MMYRKKPVIIEAIKWTGENLKEIIAFTGLHESANKWTWEEYEAVVKEKGLKIFTLEGPLMASIGDFIIRGIKGEFYPCKPDIFAATYESVETTSHAMTLTEKIEAYLGELREAFVSGAMWRQSEEVSEYHEARDYSDKWHAEALRRYPDKPKEEGRNG